LTPEKVKEDVEKEVKQLLKKNGIGS